jgi:GR25 family glycosyltransferase involved in LPS biosynthesis
MHNIYNYFEDIICINLDISTERRKHAEHYFEKLDIPAKFFTATKHPHGGMYGCFDSHIQILIDAYERDLNNILVFEDDFLPSLSYSEENLQKAIDFMKNNNDWDIFHLGYSFIKENKEGFSTIFSGKSCSLEIVQYNPFFTQALCYNKRAIKKIVDTYHEYIGIIHYDMYISSYLDFKNYCIVPMLFDQNFYFEHNNQSADAIEYLGRTLFPLLACTKLNYRISLLKYYYNLLYMKYNRYTIYLHLFIISIILYMAKRKIVKKNILL